MYDPHEYACMFRLPSVQGIVGGSKGCYRAGSSWVVNAVQVRVGETGLGSRALLSWHLQQRPAATAVTSDGHPVPPKTAKVLSQAQCMRVSDNRRAAGNYTHSSDFT